MKNTDKIKILFVCSGNICRSPLAHKYFEKIADEHEVLHKFEVDSCGTGAWHVGGDADVRMQALAKEKGWILQKEPRQINAKDMEYFDHIFVMDKGHLYELKNILPDKNFFHEKVKLFRAFDPHADEYDIEVPDPYYGEKDGFEHVYKIVERTCKVMLQSLHT